MRAKQASPWNDAGRIGVSPWVAVVILVLGALGTASVVAASSDGLERGVEAGAARYQAIGEFYLARSEAAGSARWAALASYHGQGGATLPYTDVDWFYAERMRAQAGQQRGIEADAARYQAMGGFYLAEAERGIEATAARYQAMAAFYLGGAGDALMAANPELRLARAYAQDRQVDDMLAANPELMVARAWQGQGFQGIGSCSPADEDRLAANPELMLARNEGAC